MERENFTFYAYYYEALKELKDNQRLKIYDAICAFALEGKDSELSGMEKIIFELIKPQIIKNNKRYENGRKGGRKNQSETKTKPNENQNETKNEPKVLKEDILNEKERSKEKASTFQENYTPLNPPKGSGESQKLFFERFGQFKRYAKGEYPNIDFSKLLEEFEKSSTLRKTLSWDFIKGGYENILKGDFRDKVDQNQGRDLVAERERYYSILRSQELNRVESLLQKLKGFKEFATLDKKIRELPIKKAKAEVANDTKDSVSASCSYSIL